MPGRPHIRALTSSPIPRVPSLACSRSCRPDGARIESNLTLALNGSNLVFVTGPGYMLRRRLHGTTVERPLPGRRVDSHPLGVARQAPWSAETWM